MASRLREILLAAIVMLVAGMSPGGMKFFRALADDPNHHFIEDEPYRRLREPTRGAARVFFFSDYVNHEAHWRSYSVQYAVTPVTVVPMLDQVDENSLRQMRPGDMAVLEYRDAARLEAAAAAIIGLARRFGIQSQRRIMAPQLEIISRVAP
ncbi:MAG: hypothetical protein KDB53_21690 [Planctomycetes bacterium]|nr:hypothetical protein [Planctomycetota bacterium]